MKTQKYTLAEVQGAFRALASYMDAHANSEHASGTLESVEYDILAILRNPDFLGPAVVPCNPADWAAYPYDGEAYED